jgi:hypothetical protein
MTILINIIANNNQYGLTQDAKLFVKELRNIMGSDNFQVRWLPPFVTESPPVDINVFFEIPSPLLCHFAKINIMIPNQEWFYQSWKPYLSWMDYVFCKTSYCYKLFQEIKETGVCPNTQMVKTGWTSLDRWDGISADKQDKQDTGKEKYKTFFHLAGCSPFKGTLQMIQHWDTAWPDLDIYFNQQKLQLQKNISEEKWNQSNITYHGDRVSDDSLKTKMNQAGIHLCLSQAEGFGHYLNEARSCQANVVTVNQEPMSEFGNFLVETDESKKVNFPYTLGERHEFSPTHFRTVIDSIIQLDGETLASKGIQQRHAFLEDQKLFRKSLGNVIKKIQQQVMSGSIPMEKIPMEIKESVDSLPGISIVTITRNRSRIFPLAVMNYLGIDYPRNRLEWIVVDDSDRDGRVESLLENEKIEHVHYHYLDKPLTIPQKRDFGVSKANYEIIAMMDDDDVYFPRNLLLRYAYLNFYQKSCSYCSSIGCFHIGKIISSINVPPIQYAPHQRSAEATLCFKKSFWEKQPFTDPEDPDKQGDEGQTFLAGRYDECVELPWREIIVSLLHSGNVSNRVTIGNEPNGCHFGLSDDLFKWLTSLEETAKVEEIKETEVAVS